MMFKKPKPQDKNLAEALEHLRELVSSFERFATHGFWEITVYQREGERYRHNFSKFFKDKLDVARIYLKSHGVEIDRSGE
jgi:hypothetical protein